MAFKFFRISLYDLKSDEAELNRFLAAHRIDSVDRDIIQDGPDSFWMVCVEYREQPTTKTAASSGGTRRKETKDYRDLLSDDAFQIYLGLKELRKQIAEEEKLAVYLIFTNDDLAKIAENPVTTKEELKQIEGVGQSRVEKYGDRVIEWFAKRGGSQGAAAGKSVSKNSAVGKPATGGDQGPAGQTPAK